VDRFNIVLPLAISFFTFQQISALVDASKKGFSSQNLLDYALFVSFFPQLIAGPIVRHDELVPQLQNMPDRSDIDDKMARGLLLLTLGLVKKVLIADTLATIADPLFDASLKAGLSIMDAWTAVFAFGFQICFDFSGYSDMALGLALMFGIALPENFKTPYQSCSLIDFWRRWHMTLSSFLRDYLYIPLGGSRHGPLRRSGAVAATMLLGGLWHGAGWNFIIWGGLHGAGLVVNHTWRRLGFTITPVIGWGLTFLFVMITFLIFRAQSTDSIYNLLMLVIGLGQPAAALTFSFAGSQAVVLIAAFIVALGFPEPYELSQRQFWKTPWFAAAAAVLLVGLLFTWEDPLNRSSSISSFRACHR
jgi:alginate O-acetyltransferase complex protein AlgI